MLNRSFTSRLMVVLMCLSTGSNVVQARVTEWSDIVALPQPQADAVLPYGKSASQFGELRLPKTPGPHPVVVLIHGGCWLADFSLDHVRSLAAAITAKGYATWSLEYRRLGEPGGGWPGTFLDVGTGIDYLQQIRNRTPGHALDLARVTVLGHSAGGHLALWSGARSQLKKSSELYQASPLPIRAVIGLAAISDLPAYSAGSGDCNAATRTLLGGTPSEQPRRYQDALPPMPSSLQVFLVHGEEDSIVPIQQSVAFATKPKVKLTTVPGAGHFDMISKNAPAWHQVAAAIDAAASAKSRAEED